MSRRLTAVFASNDAPLAITGIVLSAVSGLLAAGLCTLVDARVVPVGLVIGAILGFIAASAPMFMALRLILLAGLLLVASATFGTLLQHSAIVAALVMAAVAFVTAIWTALPVVGTIFSSLPATVFILLLAKGDEFAKGAPALVVALAGLLAMLPPSLLAVAVSIRDPRKFDRAMTAALWSRTTPANSRGTYSRVLLLDGAPSTLLYLAAHGSLGMVCRSWLENNSDGKDPAVAAAMAQGDANGDAIAAALLPRGPLVPRSAPVDTTAMAPAAARDPAASQADIAGQTTAAWSLWAASQQRSQAALAGDTPQRVAVRPVLLILASLVRNLVHPDVSVFRYGVQRALALGVGAFALVQSRGDENVFWVVISLAAVLQANAPSTVEKVARRSVGTFGGVLLAVALSLILPSRLLVPWVAGVALVAGFAWMKRNYTMTALLSGFAVVLLYGAPTDDVGRYAVMRAVDVMIGGVLAALVARFVMPVKPRPQARRQAVANSLRGLEEGLRQRLADPVSVPIDVLAGCQSRVSLAMSDLRLDLSLMSDHDLVQAYEQDLEGFVSDDAKLYALGMTVVDLADEADLADLPVAAALDWIRDDIDRRAAAVVGV